LGHIRYFSSSKIGVESYACEFTASIEHIFHTNTFVSSAGSEVRDVKSGQLAAKKKHAFHGLYVVRIKRSRELYRCQITAFSKHIFRCPQNIIITVFFIVKESGKINDGA
jgi:hypothetical protein